jgi:hypothetical protein
MLAYGGVSVDDPTLLSWIDTGRLIAAFMVALGVAGEFAGEYVARPINRRIEAVRTEGTARLNKQASEAQRQAAEVSERAGKLEKDAADLTAQNLALEAAIAPRRLSKKQTTELAALSSFSGRAIELKSYSNDTESLVLATEIIDALSKSPIRIQDNRLTMQGGRSVTFGVTVEGPDKPLVDALKRILSSGGNLIGTTVNTAANVGFSVQISTGVVSSGPMAATVTVGVKPIK